MVKNLLNYIQNMKKKENIFDKKKNMPKWFKPLVKNVIEGQKLDLNKKLEREYEIIRLIGKIFYPLK